MSLKSEMSFNDYISVVKRKLTIAIIFFIIAFLITIAYALYLPPVYESSGTILIESGQLLQDNQKMGYAEDRFASLKKMVMTNERLIGLAKEHHLFDLTQDSILDNDAIIVLSDIMRKSIEIELLQADAGGWGQKTTFAFTVNSQFNSAEKSYKIADEIINAFLKQNAQKEQARASESASFYEKEAQLKKSALESIEHQIEAYKRTHASSLPQTLQMHTATMERLESDLRDAERERGALEVELNSLQDALLDAKSAPPEADTTAADSSDQELTRLKMELSKLYGIYNDNHPSVKSIKRKIQALESESATVTSPLETKLSRSQKTEIAKLERRVASTKAKIRSYTSDIAQIQSRIGRTESLIAQGAQSDGVLGTLERKYKDAIDAYAVAKTKYDSAKMENNIQIENKGERFVLVESPVLPSSPVKPNRVLLILLGFFASVGGAVGLPIMIEAIDGRVRGVDSIASIMKLQPMATIPYIKNDGDEVQIKYEFYNIIYIVFSVVVLALVLVHFFVTPLDEFAAQMYNN